MDESHVPARIREIRGDLSQLQFGALINKRPETVSRWENGQTTPSLGEVILIAEQFKKPLDWFAGVDETPDERVAGAAERAESTIRSMQASLSQLLADLAAARALSVNEAKLERVVGKQGAKKRGKSVTIPREATS